MQCLRSILWNRRKQQFKERVKEREEKELERTTALPKARTATRATTEAAVSEWRFVFIVIGIVLLLTTLPVLYAYLSAPAGKTFMGILVNVPDHAQYFSWFREFMTQPLAANKLTPEPNGAIFFNLLWFGLARFAVLLGMDFSTGYQVTYQFMRIAGVILFFVLVYRLCSWVFSDVPRRRAAFLITVMAAGFGWVLVVMKYTVARGELINPLDLYVAEGNTFYSAIGFPHFIAAAIYIFTFELVLRGQAKGQYRYALFAGLFAMFMGWQHAYDLVIVYGVLAAYVLLLALRDRRIPWFMVVSSLIVGIVSVWPSLYSFLLTTLDPLWKVVLKQFSNAGVFTPPLYRLPVLMGLPLIVACFTVIADAVHDRRRRDTIRQDIEADPQRANADLFIKAWFLISFVLIYLPVDFQIHMLNGWQVPIAMLATKGLFDYIAPWAKTKLRARRPAIELQRVQKWLVAGFLLLLLPTNLYLFAWRFFDLRRHDYPYYLHNSEVDAFKWLEQNTQPADVIFSSETIGQYVPMFTGAHAYLAHWAQTADYFNKRDAVKTFFDVNTSDAKREQILKAHNVDYVLAGPAERQIGNFEPAAASFLQLAYETSDVRVYTVKTFPQ